jgi:hypothetical protein
MNVRLSSLGRLLMVAAWLLLPCPAQTVTEEVKPPTVMQGYLYQNGITPESYLLTTAEELKAFVSTLPPVTPYKNLPAPPNPDPFLHGFTVNFDHSVVAVAVGRNRIDRNPRYEGIDKLPDGSRRVRFSLSAPTAKAYPFGWAVYSAVVLPRSEAPTTVIVETVPATGAPAK